MIELVLVMMALGQHVDAGSDAGLLAESKEPKLLIYDATFDGRRLNALLLVCAQSTPVFLSAELSRLTFRALDAKFCETHTRTPFRAYDYQGGSGRLIKVPPDTCIGQRLSLPLAASIDQAISGCVEIEVGANVLSKTGKDSGFLRATTTVHASPTK